MPRNPAQAHGEISTKAHAPARRTDKSLFYSEASLLGVAISARVFDGVSAPSTEAKRFKEKLETHFEDAALKENKELGELAMYFQEGLVIFRERVVDSSSVEPPHRRVLDAETGLRVGNDEPGERSRPAADAVELIGFEPTTSTLRTWRSPN